MDPISSSEAESSSSSADANADADASAPELDPEEVDEPEVAKPVRQQSQHGHHHSPHSPHAKDREHHHHHHTPRQKMIMNVLQSWQVEVLILLMVFADLAVTGVEVGLDNEIFCVEGEVYEVAAHETVTADAASHVQVKSLPSWTSGRGHIGRSLLQVATADWALKRKAWNQKEPELPQKVRTAGSTSIVVAGIRIPMLVHDKNDKIPPDAEGTLSDHVADHVADHVDEHVDKVRSLGAEHASKAEHVSIGGAHDEADHHHEEDLAHGAVAHGFSITGSEHPDHHKIVCEGHHGPNVIRLEHMFHWMGITILACFQLEIGVKIWLEGWHFWKRPGHVLDFCVVTASLILELCLPWTLGFFQLTATVETGTIYADAYAALLLILRILRIVRLAHGLWTIAHTQWRRSARMKKDLRDALDGQEELRRENEKLRTRPPKHGGPELVGLGLDRGG